MKKIISIILCTMMILGSFSFVMAEDAVAEVEQEVKINEDFLALSTIGIFNSSLVPGGTMTRKQLAEMYVDIIIPDQGDDEYIDTKVYFDDITEPDFDVNLVYEMGIMSGAGDNKFLPNKEITYAEFIKTVINFLGYREYAENYGGFPTGYMIMASNLGFAKYAPSDVNLLITTDTVATIMRYAMSVPLCQPVYTNNMESKEFFKEDVNYLEYYTKIYTDEGVITGTYVENVIDQQSTDYYDIKIEDEPFILADNVLAINDMLGHKVVYFYQYDKHDNKVIIHYEDTDTQVQEFTHFDLNDKETTVNTLAYYNEKGKIKKIDISKANIFYNGKLCITYDVNHINPFVSGEIDGYIRVLDVDGNKETAEYVFIEAFNSYTISLIQGDEILNEYQPKIIFNTSDFDDSKIILKNILGEFIHSSDLKVSHVLNVFKNQKGDVVKAIVSTDSYLGTVDSVGTENGEISSLVVDGYEFELAANLKNNPEYNEIKPGKKVKFIFNHLGQVCDVMVGLYNPDTNYGYIMDAAYTSGMDGKYHIRLLTAANTKEVYQVADTVVFSGGTVEYVPSSKDAPEDLVPVTFDYVRKEKKTSEWIDQYLGVPVKRQVCRYTLNSKNIITELEFVDYSAIITGENEIVEYTASEDETLHIKDTSFLTSTYYRSGALSFYGKLLFRPTTPFFVVPDEANRGNDELYYAGNHGLLASNSTQRTAGLSGATFRESFKAYGYNPSDHVADAAIIEIGSESYLANSSTTKGFIIQDISSEYVDGEIIHTLTGYLGGTVYTYTMTDEAFHSNTGTVEAEAESLTSEENQYHSGDVVWLYRNREGVVTDVMLVFDMSEGKYGWEFMKSYPSNPTMSGYTNSGRYWHGQVSYLDDYSVNFDIVAADGSSKITEAYAYNGVRVYKYSENERGEPVFEKYNSTGLRWEEIHGYSSKVFTLMDSGSVSWFIIRDVD